MQTLKVISTVVKGVQTVTVEYNGKTYGVKNASSNDENAYLLMRILARTTNESNYSSLVNDGTEFYGVHQKHFCAPSYNHKTPAEIAESIIEHINKVREWVNECKLLDARHSGEATVTIADSLAEVATKLASENKLYYRSDKGQIKRLE